MAEVLQVRVREGKTELIAPYLKDKLMFVYPAYGPNTFANVKSEIEKSDLRYPTMAETVSLVYAAFQDKDNKYSEEIIDLLRKSWLWANNRILYVPNEGAYIQDNPIIENGRFLMNKSDLVKKLESKDESVRFVPFGYKINEQSSRDLSKNKFVIGLAGDEGADKSAEVSEYYKLEPYLFSFNNVDYLTSRVAGLGSGWGVGGRLLVGDGFVGWGGLALGIDRKLAA